MTASQSKSRAEFRSLYDNHPLRIEAAAGRTGRLIVSFTSAGSKRDEWPPKEFVGMAYSKGRNHVICITDISRCWMNHPGMARRVADVLGEYILENEITNVHAVGTSMGAYNALVLGKMIPFARVVAFAPQFSVHPDIVPEEDRWNWFRKQITHWPHKQVQKLGRAARKVYIFHGDSEDEKRHWTLFPTPQNVVHYIFAGAEHNFVANMKDSGVLPEIVRMGINDNPLRMRKLVTRLGGMTRSAYQGFDAAMQYFEGRRKLARPAGI